MSGLLIVSLFTIGFGIGFASAIAMIRRGK